MADKVKVCKQCKTILETGNRCPNCGSDDITDTYKGKIKIINPEKSTLAQSLKIQKKGNYALKTG